MTTWTQMKEQIELQASHDPQRAKLSDIAVRSVEEGLRHLTGVGYNFEIAPKGTLNELVELVGPKEPPTNPLSIKDSQRMLAQRKDPVNREFEALVKSPTLTN